MPVWTHDGVSLMLTSDRSGREEAYLLNADSGDTYALSLN